jgi:alkylation response protein AidB-like acyl-CoA dehydrogenase
MANEKRIQAPERAEGVPFMLPRGSPEKGQHDRNSESSVLQPTLQSARALHETIAKRAAEIERARRMPRDLLDALIAAGCFRMLLPTSHGGLAADLASAMRVLETLARADASVAWTGTGAPRLRGSWRRGAAAGVFSPSGSISPEGNGYRVTGRWSFASGCEHADWLFGNCIEGIADGAPKLRIAVFSPEQAAIEDTWNVSGLAGTGSHHFRVDGVVVPADRTLDPMVDDPCIDAVIARFPVPALASLCIGSVALGIGQGALDDITTLAQNAHFQFELARIDTELRAARALLFENAESLWATVAEGSPLTLEQRARVRAAAVWATTRASEVVTSAYRAGGGSSVYATSPLQRRLRDINAVTQHFLVRPDTLTTAGAILAGQGLAVPVF